MSWPDSILDSIRKEIHFGDRSLDCFAERPTDLNVMFAEALAKNPNGDAVVFNDTRLTYRQLYSQVVDLAAGLRAEGVGKGDRVAMLIGNRTEFLVVLMATVHIGAIAVPINIREQTPELAFILNHCGATLLIHDLDVDDRIPKADALDHIKHRFSIGGGSKASQDFLTLTENGEATAACTPVDEEDVAIILYTSGTTGRPKGAMLTHFNIVHSVMHFEQCMELGDCERSMLAVPASHVTGLVAILFTMLRVAGCTLILEVFKAQAFLETAEKEQMTHTLIVPAMYNLFLLQCQMSDYNLFNWRIGGYGGAPMPQSTIEALSVELPDLILVNAYGSTEATSPATMLPLGTGITRSDSVGIALPCADIRIVDDEGNDLPPDAHGELWIGGPMVVPGYWNNSEKTLAEFQDGYWKSGDVGSRDVEGFFRLHDRKKDMIIRGGYNIYSAEVENAIVAHEAVIECAAVSRPDKVLGEKMEVFVYTNDPTLAEEDIKSFCASSLADYKIPDFITFSDIALHRNANGKIVKRLLQRTTSSNSAEH